MSDDVWKLTVEPSEELDRRTLAAMHAAMGLLTAGGRLDLPIQQLSLVASSGHEPLEAGRFSRPASDHGYVLRYLEDEGHLRVFVHVERGGFMGRDRFRVSFTFTDGSVLSRVVEYPRHSQSGADFGPLGDVRLEDVATVSIENAE